MIGTEGAAILVAINFAIACLFGLIASMFASLVLYRRWKVADAAIDGCLALVAAASCRMPDEVPLLFISAPAAVIVRHLVIHFRSERPYRFVTGVGILVLY